MTNSAPAIGRLLTRSVRSISVTSLFVISIAVTVVAQTSATDGSTPLAIAPGAPAGSYPLSGLDNINPYNGNLNFVLPLLHIGGRGSTGYTMMLPIEQHWRVLHKSNELQEMEIPDYNGWKSITPKYVAGVLEGRLGKDPNLPCPPNYHLTTLLARLTFTAPDGTEYELRDQLTGGQPQNYYCGGGALFPSRGTVFVTADGTSATFVSDATIRDDGSALTPSGYVSFRDGTRYRIDNGVVTWIRDRNGNKVTVGSGIMDSLNRQVSVVPADFQSRFYDEITFKGFGGAIRTIRVNYTLLQNVLRTVRPGDLATVQTKGALFPQLTGSSSTLFNPYVVSSVVLPDGVQQYQFLYNVYGELARVTLPTGGAIEYDFGSGILGDESGVFWTGVALPEIYRRVLRRRVYVDGGLTLEGMTTFSRPEYDGHSYVEIDHLSNNQTTLISRERHYFYGSASSSFERGPLDYPGWQEGKEYQTEAIGTDGATVLRRTVDTWQQGCPVSTWSNSIPNNPRVAQNDTILSDTNQVATQTFAYDCYNNRTDTYEYDYGLGVAGSLIRHSHTDYVTSANYTGVSGAHLRVLPAQVSIYDSAYIERARTSYEYDNYTSDTNHAPLTDRSNISGFDVSFSTSYLTRGNVTATTRYLLLNGSVTGSISSFAQYDIAGNGVKTIDARGYATYFDFSDRFGTPDGEARANNGAPELAGQTTFAFPTLGTNALGHTAYTQFDYYLGRPVDGEDANGIVGSGYYNDSLDRPKQIIRAANQEASVKSQTTFSYDDINHIITTTSDQNTFNDNLLKSEITYDGLGRTTDKRQYETATAYITVRQEYDALGRTYRTSNPFRSGESLAWTRTGFDELGRVVSVTTPDGAIVSTTYSGDRVLVTDQAWKQRISRTNALGQLKDVWEVTAADGATEAISFPNHPEVIAGYHTSYNYDALDDLTTVNQGSQTRSFDYNSLKRLTSANNPESGTVNYQYDANGNLLVKTDARGVSSHYQYDALNRVTRRWYNGSSAATATTHNDPALPTGVAASDEVKYFYDSQNLLSGAPTIDRGYAIGRLVAVTYGGSSAGTYLGYDAVGRALRNIQQTGGVNYQTSALYNLAGGIRSQTYPSEHSVNYDYDTAGRLSSFTGNLGDGTTQRTYATGITYSPFGGMTQEQFGTTTAPVYDKRHYNVRGQLYDIRVSTVPWATDQWNWNRGAVINWYDSTSNFPYQNPNSGTDNNGNVLRQEVYVPDNDQISSYTFRRQNYTYDTLNRLMSVTELANGTTPSFAQYNSYDRFGNRLVDQVNTWGQNIPKPNFGGNSSNQLTAPAGYTMTYDAAGNLVNDTYTGAGARTYDAENRMKQAWANGQWQTYVYDGDGRRINRIVDNTEIWQVYGIGGELVAEYGVNGAAASPQKEYGYRNGELLITATITGGWGAPPTLNDNPLQVGFTTVQARHITELRDAINALRSRMSLSAYSWQYSATTNDYISANPILEMRTALDQALGAGNYAVGLATGQPVKAVHIQELRDRVLAAWQSGGSIDVRWLVSDQLGTPRMVFDQTGSLANVSRHDYLPFGEELFAGTGGRTTGQGYSQPDGVRQRFTGYEHDDETGLDFAEARYFSSFQGRFTSPDPLNASAAPNIPQSWNRYTYGLNNPLLYTDPTGEIWVRSADGRNIVWFSQERWDNEISKARDANGNPLYTPLSQSEMEFNTNFGRVRLNPNGPDVNAAVGSDAYLGFSIVGENRTEYSVALATGLAIAARRGGGRNPLLFLGTAAIATLWMLGEPVNQGLPLVDPNVYTQGDRDARKANPDRVEAARQLVEQLRRELAKLESKPNKTPDDKNLVDKIKAAIRKQLDRMKKSETHGRKGKR